MSEQSDRLQAMTDLIAEVKAVATWPTDHALDARLRSMCMQQLDNFWRVDHVAQLANAASAALAGRYHANSEYLKKRWAGVVEEMASVDVRAWPWMLAAEEAFQREHTRVMGGEQ